MLTYKKVKFIDGKLCEWGVTKDGKRCKKKPGRVPSNRTKVISPVQYTDMSGGPSKEAMIRAVVSETGRPKSYYADWSKADLRQRLETLIEYE